MLPLVIVPGILEDEASWSAALAELGPTLEVVPNAGATVPEMAAALLARAPQRFVLLGHSLGGYVAMEAALTAPDRLAGLVLVSTSARSEDPANRAARERLVATAREDFDGVVARLARAALAPANRAAHVAEVTAMMRAAGIERFGREQGAAGARPPLADRVARLACPALVLSGREDSIIAPQASEELAQHLPRATLHLFPGCGHMPHLESRGAFREALQRWIAREM